jgi:hypothetical protein
MSQGHEQTLPRNPGDEPLVGEDLANDVEYIVDRITPAEAKAIADRPDEFYDGVVARAVRKRGTRTTIPTLTELSGIRYPTEVTLKEENMVLRALSAFHLRRPTSVLRIQARDRSRSQPVDHDGLASGSSHWAA